MIRKVESPDINMPELQVHFLFPVLFWCYMNFNSADSNRIISGLNYLKGKEELMQEKKKKEFRYFDTYVIKL